MSFQLATLSFFTLGLLGSFLFAVIGAAMFVGGQISAPVMLGLTVLFSVVWWWISPWILDWTLRWTYSHEWITLDQLRVGHPEIAGFVEATCAKHKISVPRLGLIKDDAPTAFTYGATANNARLVVSCGLLELLSPAEAKAVYAHELGHIVHRDFIVMSIGATMVQLLYQLYVVFTRSKGDKKGQLALVGVAAFVFYLIGTYALLFLSRTREYMADAFAAEETGDPNALATALSKIAFGILEAEQKAGQPSKLLAGTRALGIFDHKAARSVGVAAHDTVTHDKLGRVFLFDLFNPWAAVAELSSTHPLTGKRIRALSNVARQQDQTPAFDFAAIAAAGNALDHGRLRGTFAREVGIYFAPWLLGPIGLVAGAFTGHPLGGLVAGVGLGHLLTGWYSFGPTEGAPAESFLDLMADPYASPLRGRPVRLSGNLIGKADAGSAFGEDFMLRDRTGMVYLNYESPFGLLGNLWFGSRRAGALIGRDVQATGWFRRGVMPQFDLQAMQVEGGERVKSYTRAWSLIPGGLVLAIGVGLLAAGV